MKNGMKKLLSLLLCLVFIFSMIPAAAYAEDTETAMYGQNEPALSDDAGSAETPQEEDGTQEEDGASSENEPTDGTDSELSLEENGIVMQENAVPVSYLDAAGEEQTCDNYTVINEYYLPYTWSAGWYVVSGTADYTEGGTQTNGITCSGDVHLILTDGCALSVKGADGKAGICVGGDGNSLTVYGQSGGTGKLDATGSDGAGFGGGAGIGGGLGCIGSNITINGGTVTATSVDGGAGIGGGENGDGSNITINGGTVTATGGFGAGAGIGGGYYGDGSNIRINGGTVTATGGECGGAGIGGGVGIGVDGNGSNITITGGTVTATGVDGGAGIGGGEYGSGSNITISGGTVTATGGLDGAGIGGGYFGSGSDITITGGYINAKGTDGGEDIGKGKDGTASGITLSGGCYKNKPNENYLKKFYVCTQQEGSYPYTINKMNLNPELTATIIPAPNTDPIASGTVITYNCSVKNTGNIILDNVTVDFPLIDYTHTIPTLAPGANWSDTADYTVTDNDMLRSKLISTLYANAKSITDTETGITYNPKATASCEYIFMQPVSYLNDKGEICSCDNYTLINSANLLTTWTAGWYVVTDTADYTAGGTKTGGITCNGAVHLILTDGCSLSVKGADSNAGICVSGAGNSLSIYGQSGGTGALKAVGGTGGLGADGGAGIGGGYMGNGSNITISGGTVTATGGVDGAGIGGGAGCDGSNITISSGTVTATGSDGGAGIGGGCWCSGSNITISGGTVTATGGKYGAGIGGGYFGSGSDITITGGYINAKGTDGEEDIGSGKDGTASGITLSGGCYTNTPKAAYVPAGYRIAKNTDSSTSTLYPHTVAQNIPVSYLDAAGEEQICDNYKVINEYYLPTAWSAGWYVVQGTVNYPTGGITCSGAVHLILTDGCSLSVKGADSNAGICVIGTDNFLTVYGQSGGTGKLDATGSDGGAGIGGGSSGNGSNITINGGTVTATGSDGGAGIGGGSSGNGSSITINGGIVTATGGDTGAGIGGGFAGSGSNIKISGGTVTATGGDRGAGIGGGDNGIGGGSNITINGGTVTATGSDGGAGIGGGYAGAGNNITIDGGTVTATSIDGGAGIGGGGDNGDGSNITINGGTVKAGGGTGGAGIGGGYFGSGSNITINGGTVTATGGDRGAGIGGGWTGSGSHITISGGCINATGKNGGEDIGSGKYGSAASGIELKGGCYANKPDSKYIPDGYYSGNNTDTATKADYPYIIQQAAGCLVLDGDYPGTFSADGEELEADCFKGKTYIKIPDGAKVLTYYEFHAGSDAHGTYPVSMKVWLLSYDAGSGKYTASAFSALDNLLSYHGTSIRTSGKRGVRVVTGIDEALKKQLISGLNGYKLTEYGTVMAWTKKLNGDGLTLEHPDAVHNFAYSAAGGKDPVYRQRDGRIWYTNVLLLDNLTDEWLKEDITMRPYLKLSDGQGNELVIYGGEVLRSVGYVAYQNRSAFRPGTAEYEYIWDIIHKVYGSQYDSEYVKK